MTASVSWPQKVFYAAVGLLAAWVGFWGFFIPEHIEKALPWFPALVPPLHARFLGAIYLSGTAAMIAALFARHWPAMRVIVPIISIWTGTLFIVSFFYLPTFDWSRQQVWIWFGAYFLLINGAVFVLFYGLNFIFPQGPIEHGPWAFTELTARTYCGWQIATGLLMLFIAWENEWQRIRLATLTLILLPFAALFQLLRYSEQVNWAEAGRLIVTSDLLFVAGVFVALWLQQTKAQPAASSQAGKSQAGG